MESGGKPTTATPGKAAPPAASAAPLRKLGRYIIKKKLGAGGMGTVYRAVDEQLKRVVALKVLPRDKAQNEMLVKRFKAEARAAATLKHPNIVGVYDSGEVDGYLYIAMEHVDGIDLHELVKRKGVVSPRRSLDIMKQATAALQHAFEKGIVHRDIKPSNFLINREGQVKLADMGLARSLTDTAQSGITRAGTTVGTVDYMSPEQTRDSKSADSRSDIYSLGATWYHMLVGAPLFPDGDLLNKIHAHGSKPPPDPRDSNSEVPEAFVAIMHRMLSKKPADRYQTPAELLAELSKTSSKKRELTSDMLAALASSDDEDNAVSRSMMNQPAPGSSDEQSRIAALLDDPDSDDEVEFSPDPDNPPSSSPSTRPPAPPRTTSGTSEPERSSQTITPPGPDKPPPKRLERSRSQGFSVSFDTGRIAAIVIGVAIVAGIIGLVANHLRTRDTPPPANGVNGESEPDPEDTPPTEEPDSRPQPNNRPQKLDGAAAEDVKLPVS